MISTSVKISPLATAFFGTGRWAIATACSFWSGVPAIAGRHIPPAVPADQAYYWSALWQSGIRESREALEHGRFREFDSGTDLARWLLTENDD